LALAEPLHKTIESICEIADASWLLPKIGFVLVGGVVTDIVNAAIGALIF
jgi:hypothetical protein